MGSVVLDDEAAVRLAIEHLKQLGHRRIAYIGGPNTVDWAHRRRRGYENTMAELGDVVPKNYIVEGGYQVESGESAFSRLIREASELPTGIVVANVLAGIGVLAGAMSCNICIPDDLSIVAIHDVWVADHTCPPLTTVRMPMRELGEASTKLLLKQIDGESGRNLVVRNPKPELVRRGSTSQASNV